MNKLAQYCKEEIKKSIQYQDKIMVWYWNSVDKKKTNIGIFAKIGYCTWKRPYIHIPATKYWYFKAENKSATTIIN